jgi:Asparagine synthase (glutamine-hydrolyzing)
MCGITGWVDLLPDGVGNSDRDLNILTSMCGRIRHRGPDSEGVFQTNGVALGMRRLAVVDLVHRRTAIF